LCGCFAQAFPERAAPTPQADVVCGTGNRAACVDAICKFIENRERSIDIATNGGKTFEPLFAPSLDGHTRAFLKIEDGCERYCSYCIVPFARGPVRSMPLGELVRQVETFAENGYAEIVLSGINLSCYGRGEGFDLADAVAAAASVSGISRVRIGSIEPDLLSDDILSRLAAVSKLCPHFHLALQSGCDATLARMNRHYTSELFSTVAAKLCNLFDHPTFTTDVIVGFPGESESEFSDSLSFVESFGFLKIHVFPYSIRDGTAAAAMPCQITREIKEMRAAAMTAAAEHSRKKLMECFVGTRARVIVERPHSDGTFHGYTDRYLPALLCGTDLHERQTVEGVIARVDTLGDCCVIELP
ncbi:MAG: MiaB/RimO family radical SAM methylthiotransferase, partial [Oscillospiraceae bacterium]